MSRGPSFTPFVFSTAYAGLAGSLYAHLNRYIAPDAFTLAESINFLIIVVVGGMGTLLGPLVGAAIIVYLRESLLILKDLNMLIYGAMLMLLMIFMPRGLVGTVGSFAARFRAWWTESNSRKSAQRFSLRNCDETTSSSGSQIP